VANRGLGYYASSGASGGGFADAKRERFRTDTEIVAGGKTNAESVTAPSSKSVIRRPSSDGGVNYPTIRRPDHLTARKFCYRSFRALFPKIRRNSDEETSRIRVFCSARRGLYADEQ
jgi:hypothetical protein